MWTVPYRIGFKTLSFSFQYNENNLRMEISILNLFIKHKAHPSPVKDKYSKFKIEFKRAVSEEWSD